MTIQYLVDTDWAIHYLNDHEGIVQRLRELQRQEGLALSIISLTELYEGVYYSREPEDDERALQDFLCGVTILGIDEHTCQIFGKERGRLRASGTPRWCRAAVAGTVCGGVQSPPVGLCILHRDGFGKRCGAAISRAVLPGMARLAALASSALARPGAAATPVAVALWGGHRTG